MSMFKLTPKEIFVTIAVVLILGTWVWDEIAEEEQVQIEHARMHEHFEKFDMFYEDYVLRHKSMKEFDH